MAAEQGSSGGLPTGPQEVRITEHTKMRAFVAFSLKFLQENPDRPLVLHTLPLPEKGKPTPDEETHEDISPEDEPPRKKQRLQPPKSLTPRLVSVVEIIKREYAVWAENRTEPDGRPVDAVLRSGLHQYNELGTLEDLGFFVPQEEEDDVNKLRHALGGKNFLRQKMSPHLKVTLSVRALPELEAKGSTHQPPIPIRKSRSEKRREKKRQKEVQVGGENNCNSD